MTSIVYTSAKSKKKKRGALTAKEKELKAHWESLLKRHASPLERGQKNKGGLKQGKPQNALNVDAPVPAKDSYAGMKGVAALKPVNRYTGDKCIGVALMHKSNYTPVFQAEDAVAIAKMRR